MFDPAIATSTDLHWSGPSSVVRCQSEISQLMNSQSALPEIEMSTNVAERANRDLS